MRAGTIFARHTRRIIAPPLPSAVVWRCLVADLCPACSTCLGAAARIFSPSKCSFPAVVPLVASTSGSSIEIHRRCTGRLVGATSTEGLIGGWRSTRRRGPRRCYRTTVLEETHLSSTGHRLGAAVRAEFSIEVVDVGLDRAQRDEQPASNFPVGIARGDERKNLDLPLAKGLGEPHFGNRGRPVLSGEGRHELREVRDRDADRGVEVTPLASFGHRWSLVHEGPDVTLRFCLGEGQGQGAYGLLLLAFRPKGQRLQRHDLYH